MNTLRKELDAYIECVGLACAIHEEQVTTAGIDRSGRVLAAETLLAESLLKTQQRERKSIDEVQSKYDEQARSAAHQRAVREKHARNKHAGRIEWAKKEREEALWLSDALVESSLRKSQSGHQSALDSIKDQSEIIDGLMVSLAQEIGASVFNELVEKVLVDSPKAHDLTIDGLIACIHLASESMGRLNEGGLLRHFRGRTKQLDIGSGIYELVLSSKVYAQTLVARSIFLYEEQVAAIHNKHKEEFEHAHQACLVISQNSEQNSGSLVRDAYEWYQSVSAQVESFRSRDLKKIEQEKIKLNTSAQRISDAAQDAAELMYSQTVDGAKAELDAKMLAACDRLDRSSAEAMEKINVTDAQALASNLPWEKMADAQHPQNVPKVVTIAHSTLDLHGRLGMLGDIERQKGSIPSIIKSQIVLALPGTQSLFIRHDVSSRDIALATMRNVMLRILASFPAGKVRFTMVDPVGIGQSFAGFMPLSDLEPSPVGKRIWSDPIQVERQLADITEHMQTVIQKYLRSDYETIEEYNEAAGEISEPYRFVVIADLPEALSETGAARLKSILESGPRCGVYAILASDVGDSGVVNSITDAIELNSVCLNVIDGLPRFIDDRLDELAISLEAEPDDDTVSKILARVAQAGTDAGRVEVAFGRLAPAPDEYWSRTCDNELVIPIGRSGARKTQELRLGFGTRQHALIAGRTGSGKSTLLHVIISTAGLWYSPDELEMYLIDFKKGVEFKAYTQGRLPHVRAVAIESDREFGLSVLKRLDDELVSRGELFRKIGAQDLASARSLAPDEKLPRVLLLIDEFQEFFTEDDEVSSESTLLLDRLVRQGRAFGVHVVLGSQTLAGAYSLARSTLGQIGIRVALQCSEADSYLILGEDNNAARLLERPGEAIYNNAGGLVEGNSPFQTAWLPDVERDEYLDRIPDSSQYPLPVVFEGNLPAKFDQSSEAFAQAYPDRKTPRILLGDAVAIAPPTSVVLEKRSGSNLLVVGPQPEPALGILIAAAITAGSTPKVEVIFIDPTPEDHSLSGRVLDAVDASSAMVRVVSHREADRVINELNAVVQSRGDSSGDPVILVLGGVHRLRSLRKSDDYSFSLDEDSVSPDKELANILREGPPAGVWTLAWCDTLTSLERSMERSTIREFGLRALMQMSASDSSALVDSSIASTLGANRAILADDVAGTFQKFRPINLPEASTVRRAEIFLTNNG